MATLNDCPFFKSMCFFQMRSLSDLLLPTLAGSMLMLLINIPTSLAQPGMSENSDMIIKDKEQLCNLLPVLFRLFGDSLTIDIIKKTRGAESITYSQNELNVLCNVLAQLLPRNYIGFDCASASFDVFNVIEPSVVTDGVAEPSMNNKRVYQIVILTTPEGGGQSRVFYRLVEDSMWCFLLYEGGDALNWSSEYYVRNSDSTYSLRAYFSSTSFNQIVAMRGEAMGRYACTPIYVDGDAGDTAKTLAIGLLDVVQNRDTTIDEGDFWFLGSVVVCDRRK